MSNFLVTYLDSIDERLLEYLDEDDELSLDTVRRLRLYTSELLTGSITLAHLSEDWPDWFHLAPAFAATYGSDDLQELEHNASLILVIEDEHDERVRLTGSDRTYLSELESQLDMYPEMRMKEE